MGEPLPSFTSYKWSVLVLMSLTVWCWSIPQTTVSTGSHSMNHVWWQPAQPSVLSQLFILIGSISAGEQCCFMLTVFTLLFWHCWSGIPTVKYTTTSGMPKGFQLTKKMAIKAVGCEYILCNRILTVLMCHSLLTSVSWITNPVTIKWCWKKFLFSVTVFVLK